jgi:hypothetical protein
MVGMVDKNRSKIQEAESGHVAIAARNFHEKCQRVVAHWAGLPASQSRRGPGRKLGLGGKAHALMLSALHGGVNAWIEREVQQKRDD